MISCAVVAHTARLEAATELAKTIGGVVSLDDGTAGAEANHLRAWELTRARPSQWAAVLEDDAQPVPSFTRQAEAALSAAPADIVSFYLGRARPPRRQQRIHTALHHVDVQGAHWITSIRVLHAVAVAMRTELRDDWLNWAPSSKLPADERLTEWCKTRGHTVAYTMPSLVDHQDLPTLVDHRDRQPRTEPRIAWRTGTRDQWNSKTVSM